MKISLNWLNDYVPVRLKSEELAHRLTMAGLEVKKIEIIGGDTVFEIEVTPNRPDCLSLIGIARETSAILNIPLKIPGVGGFKISKEKVDITISDKKDCARYIGAIVKNISVKSSGDWLKNRLIPVGVRCINNIVDITNFCLLETGQPLHAFDLDKLSGGKIIVRRAKDNETITTIDGVERKLDPSILVIADAKRAVAIAGIMGGKDAEVTEQTKNILLESAYFDPVLIRRGARKLGLSSDSSYRFERGVDINGVAATAKHALLLINDEAKGTLSAYTDLYLQKIKISKTTITLNLKKVDRLLGQKISSEKCKNILKKLGFKINLASKNALKIVPPDFRLDVRQDVDVIEEIARMIGYDRIPVSLPQIKVSSIISPISQMIKKTLSSVLCGYGLNEAISYTMISRKFLEKTNLNETDLLKVKNPLTQEQEIMRPSVLPGLLAVVSTNLNRGQKDIHLFECGKIYSSSGEKETLTIVMTGQYRYDWRNPKTGEADLFDLKGIIENLLKTIGIKKMDFAPLSIVFLDEGQAANILAADKKIGFLGKVSGQVLDQWDIKKKKVFFAQLDLEKIFLAAQPIKNYQPITLFPGIVRDISLAVKDNVSFEQIRALVRSHDDGLVKQVNFMEQYLGEKIPAGHRGLIFSLIYQDQKRTLREEEVAQVHEKICQSLTNQLGAIRR
ncbi:MAG: phenylalanine--tRNA ligase subunit beta [Candidatus Omnitrophota bacterium]